MDLFVVNRYYGDERSSEFLLDHSAPKREVEETKITEVPNITKKKKKSESDVNPLPDPVIGFSEGVEVCDIVTTCSKKKKSKRKQTDVTEEINEIQEDMSIENDTSILNRNDDTSCSREIEACQTPASTSAKKKSKRRQKEYTSENNKTPNTEESKKDSTCNEHKDPEASEVSKQKKNKRKLNPVFNDIPSEENQDCIKVNCIENSNNDNDNISCNKKNKRKSEKSNTSVLGDNEVSRENENSSKNKKIKKLDTPPDISPEENQGNMNKSQDIDNLESENNEMDKMSSSKKKKKTVKHSLNAGSEVLIINENPSNKKKKIKTSNTSPDAKKDFSSSISNGKTKCPQNNIENSLNDTNTSKLDGRGTIDNEKNKPDETSKKGKKRFRQRARYKDKPKIESSKDHENITDKETVDKGSSEDEEEKKDRNDLGGFQVIGNLEFHRKKKVKRVLPDWLAKPTVISVNLKNLNSKIEDLQELDPYFKKLLRKNGVTHFFPVQSELIPFLIKQHSRRTIFWPRDVCVSAPTGSGKTLAFVLPILQLLQYRVVPRIRALIVLPTQDLASQVHSVFKSYVKGTKLQVVLTVGSSPIQEEQKKLLLWDIVKEKHVSLVDIVVTTPGRLVDHLTSSPGFDLSGLKFLVVDEADRMIDNNDCNWLLHINKHINYLGSNSAPPLMLHTFLTYPSRPQRLLFSATLSHDPEKLHTLGLFQPKLFTSVVDATGDDSSHQPVSAATSDPLPSSSGFIGKFTTPAELKEKLTVTATNLKPLVVHQLIQKHAWKGVLCFVNTAQGAHRLAKLLHLIDAADPSATKLNIAEVYSDLKLEQRNKIIQDFRRRKIDIVVASDNLARGIDVENIDVVINYEAPDNIKKYIHRIGRTARGGREGTSVTLVTPHERNTFLKMLSSVGKQNIEDLECEEEGLEHLEQVYVKALELLKRDVEREGEMTLKTAKAEKKGKIIKKKKVLLDGKSNKTVKRNTPNKSANKTEQKKPFNNQGNTEKTMAKSKKDKPASEKIQNTSLKIVKRNQIKTVVKKKWKLEGKRKKPNKKQTPTQDVGSMRNEGEKKNALGMKRNRKIKMKKQLKKKQTQNQTKTK